MKKLRWIITILVIAIVCSGVWVTLAPIEVQGKQTEIGQPITPEQMRAQAVALADCPAPGSVERSGWVINYETTESDGTAVYDVTFNGMSIMKSAKNVEWHTDYGDGGFADSIGCGINGLAFPFTPFGETELHDLADGFELVQDYRMLLWGEPCNDRYEQRFQFYDDGRFQILAGAYGRGCGSDAASSPIYRPIMRIDIALNDDENNTLAVLEGDSWIPQLVETWWEPMETLQWRVTDSFNMAYDIRPNEGDNAYFYVTRHQPNEGDTDLGISDSTSPCCTDSSEQWPNEYINEDVTTESNIVLWYVPQFQSSSEPGSEFCWTEQGEPDPIVFPCFGGLMFAPVESIPTAVTTSFLPSPANYLTILTWGVAAIVGILTLMFTTRKLLTSSLL